MGDLRGLITVVRVPSWGFDYERPGWYWGWRHSVQIGPWLVFWGKMSGAEICRDYDNYQNAILRALEAEGRG